ncbi:conserved Plasmodium protein, unknown function [Plasmodium gallinaceum]|uniref:Uncharacterized protein n=1 Tax=Plasmodium gallinaceum TaxID=5849 RepID=A0A1J1GXF9_PLAGA|nr:conserved Plasmodium protein, unknown function [Plasmodium gallinaceum]CRG97249.1 conserved Plasmodium protein, unknown function [Plasmodium gallinaceum]
MVIKNNQDKKRNFKILLERRIILSQESEKHIDKSIYTFYGICLISLSISAFIFSSMFFFFKMHPYAIYYFIVNVGSIPIYILYQYFKWISLELFKYS